MSNAKLLNAFRMRSKHIRLLQDGVKPHPYLPWEAEGKAHTFDLTAVAQILPLAAKEKQFIFPETFQGDQNLGVEVFNCRAKGSSD